MDFNNADTEETLLRGLQNLVNLSKEDYSKINKYKNIIKRNIKPNEPDNKTKEDEKKKIILNEENNINIQDNCKIKNKNLKNKEKYRENQFTVQNNLKFENLKKEEVNLDKKVNNLRLNTESVIDTLSNNYIEEKNPINKIEEIENFVEKCFTNEKEGKSIKKALTKVKFENSKKLGMKIRKTIKKIRFYDDLQEKDLLKNAVNTMKNKGYLMFTDSDFKTKLISKDNNNIFRKIDFVNNISEKSAFYLKDSLNNILSSKSNLPDINKNNTYNKRSSSAKLYRTDCFDPEKIQKKRELIDNLYMSTNKIKCRILKSMITLKSINK